MALWRFFCCCFFFCHLISAKYFLPLAKDDQNTQFYTSFLVGAPPLRIYVAVDIGIPFSWLACDTVGYRHNRSSTTRNFLSPLITDTFTIHSSSPPIESPLPHFPFACTDNEPLKGLSSYTKGVVSFARTPRSLHSHVSSSLNVPRKFALCPPSSSASGLHGAVYFGGGPYVLPPNTADLSKSQLVTTALVVNPHNTCPYYNDGGVSVEYFIDVRSIEIDGTPLKFNASLLSTFDKDGKGGSKISTMGSYTALHPLIYKPFVDLFVSKAAALGLVKVDPVAPFRACFSSRSIRYDAKIGKGLPVIDLVLKEKNSRWRIYGSNSMVKVSKDVQCLGFVDGGEWGATASIAIGAKQLEDNLVEFDLEGNKLRLTSSLLLMGTNCSRFKGF